MTGHQPSTVLAFSLTGAVMLWSSICASVSAQQPIETTLTIGEGWAVVREMRRFDLVPGEQEILLEGIPAQADLSSLTIRTRRIPVELLTWHRVGPGAQSTLAPTDAESLIVTPNGVIHGASTASLPTSFPRKEGPVRCRVRIPVGGARSLEVVYRVEGLQWTSYYQVFIRGEPDGLDESVALDLTGFVRINNPTGRSFTNTLVRLVGADPRLPREPERRTGFLMLADTPLADLWKVQEVDPPPEFNYRMPRRANIPSHAETEVHFIASHRIPASRRYVMDSTEVPLSMTGAFRPLQQYLVFKNNAANRLGWSLPPGPVEVFHGVTRRTMRLPGFLPHTPINREIRVHLGKVENVLGMRRSVRRTELQFGHYEETFQLTVENQRPNAIALEIHERPSLTLTWDVQRASEEYELDGGWIRMTPRIPGGETREIDVRLRFHQPTL